jgi:hypothetical protein
LQLCPTNYIFSGYTGHDKTAADQLANGMEIWVNMGGKEGLAYYKVRMRYK